MIHLATTFMKWHPHSATWIWYELTLSEGITVLLGDSSGLALRFAALRWNNFVLKDYCLHTVIYMRTAPPVTNELIAVWGEWGWSKSERNVNTWLTLRNSCGWFDCKYRLLMRMGLRQVHEVYHQVKLLWAGNTLDFSWGCLLKIYLRFGKALGSEDIFNEEGDSLHLRSPKQMIFTAHRDYLRHTAGTRRDQKVQWNGRNYGQKLVLWFLWAAMDETE